MSNPANRLRLAAMCAAGLLCVGGFVAWQSASAMVGDDLPALVDRAQLNDHTGPIRDLLPDEASHRNGGIWFTGTLFRNAARVITSLHGVDNLPPEECSGIVIDRRHVLTAAHCVCGNALPWMRSTAQACRAILPHVTADVVVPGTGLFHAVAAPAVHPGYRNPVSVDDGAPKPARYADLAILTLDSDVPVDPIPIDAPDANDRLYVVGAGKAALSPGTKIYPTGQELNEGVFLTSRLSGVGLVPADCGGNPADVFCVRDDGVGGQNPALDGTGACGGDSGGGVYALDRDGRQRLVGVVSFVVPNIDNHCLADANSTIRTFAVRPDLYADWIRAVAGKAIPAARDRRRCADAMGDYGTKGYFAIATGASTVTIGGFDTGANGAPVFAITNVPPKACTVDNERHFAACTLAAGDRPLLHISSGFVQIAACWSDG